MDVSDSGRIPVPANFELPQNKDHQADSGVNNDSVMNDSNACGEHQAVKLNAAAMTKPEVQDEASQKASAEKLETSAVTKPEVEEEPSHKASAEKLETSPGSQPSATDASADDAEDSQQTRLQKNFQENPYSYNGAVRDKYSWAQSITDVDVYVKIPANVKKGKQVQVEIKRRFLKVQYQEESGEWTEQLNEDLSWEVNKEESLWSLVPGDHIHINLEKVQERWWENLLVNEDKISVRKIDASRPITDLDEEAQAKIGEMMYNENQKRLGLPQSHEQKVGDVLKKAWDAEGSPFQGQPFDLSKVNITNPGSFSS